MTMKNIEDNDMYQEFDEMDNMNAEIIQILMDAELGHVVSRAS